MSNGDNKATLVAIMKDEAPYILEWVAYHRLIGFDKISIYSNDSTDGSDLLLGNLSAAGVIDHTLWESTIDASPQKSAYNDALRRCETEWICFLDADEFLTLKEDRSVDAFLERFPSTASAIGVNWRIFGSSGETMFRPDLVVARFQLASTVDAHPNMHIKTIARRKNVDVMHVHACALSSGDYVNSSGEVSKVINYGYIKPIQTRLAQINHYCVKSKEEFENKKIRGNATLPLGAPRKTGCVSDKFFLDHDLNHEHDVTLFNMRDAIHEEIGRLKSMVEAVTF